MITPGDVLDYVKINLGAPVTIIEKSESEIIDYWRRHVLKEFSKFVPDQNGYIVIDPTDDTVQTDIPNQFKILDPGNREIISVMKVLPNLGLLYIHDFPINTGVRRFGEVPDFMLETTIGSGAYQNSPMYITWKFFHPNLIEVYPRQIADQQFGVRYERVQTFESIPLEWDYEFKELCLAHTELMLGAIREKFSSFETPFGTINLNAQELKQGGAARRQAVIEKLDKQPPNLLLEVG